jgi:hypothetical protein
MPDLPTKMILELHEHGPMPIKDIAEHGRGEKKTNKQKCEQRCAYKLENVEGEGIGESFTDGRRKIYKISENVEILRGKLVLNDENGNTKYEEEIKHILRMMDDGQIRISILEE